MIIDDYPSKKHVMQKTHGCRFPVAMMLDSFSLPR